MYIIEITPLENGAHSNQSYDHGIEIPKGWALIQDETTCENFPFGDVEVEEMEVEGIGLVPVVTRWIPGVMPEPEQIPETPTDSTDLETRVTALESAIERGLTL